MYMSWQVYGVNGKETCRRRISSDRPHVASNQCRHLHISDVMFCAHGSSIAEEEDI